MKSDHTDPTTLSYALHQKYNVMKAVVLRDMRTRFFDHGLGFLIVALWPLAHMIILLGIYHFAGRQAPFGDSLNVFFASGLIPTLLFVYVSRFMSLSVILNRPMLAFPVVQVLDILMARAYLEIIAAFLTLFFMFSILLLLGENPWPANPVEAVLAYISTALLAVGVGILVGVIAMFFNFAVTIYALLMILAYASSGTLFVTAYLPDLIAIPLSWNPITQAVEWMRTAYFETYPDRLLDRSYLVGFALTALFGGLFLERVCRRIMLES